MRSLARYALAVAQDLRRPHSSGSDPTKPPIPCGFRTQPAMRDTKSRPVRPPLSAAPAVRPAHQVRGLEPSQRAGRGLAADLLGSQRTYEITFPAEEMFEEIGPSALRAGLGSYEQRSDRTRDLDARVNHNAPVKQRVREFHRRIAGTPIGTLRVSTDTLISRLEQRVQARPGRPCPNPLAVATSGARGPAPLCRPAR